MSSPDEIELAALLDARQQADADRSAIDAAIYARFGRDLAVMCTDLVGFSRQVEAFGIVHFLTLIHASERLFLPLIDQHGGRCLKSEGDSLMVTFASPHHALACAQAMLQATQAYNPGRAEHECLHVCIGIGFGTLLCVGERDVWGAEVNAASRLGEDMAKGGEILVTAAVRDACQSNHHFAPHGVVFGNRPVFKLGES